MKNILLILFIICSYFGFSQTNTGGQYNTPKVYDSTRLRNDSVLYHYAGPGLVKRDTIRLASSGGGGGSYSVANGLYNVGSLFKLGGVLTENTSIGSGNYTFSLNNKVYNNTSQRSNFFTDTISIILNGSRFLHTTSTPSALNGNVTYGNQFEGYQAGASFGVTSDGYANTVYGRRAAFTLNGTRFEASSNAIYGYSALENTQYAMRNAVFGVAAMGTAAVGTPGAPLTGNVAVGHHAYRNGGGSYNIAIGASAMENASSSVTDCIGIGQYSLRDNVASFNVGIGTNSLYSNTIGTKNTALGWGTGQSASPATAGFTQNTFIGYISGGGGAGNTNAGGYNTCVGANSGSLLSSGNSNTFIGNNAGASNTSGGSNIFIGNNSGANGVINSATGSNNIAIGNAVSLSTSSASNELNIGNALFGQNFGGTSTVFRIPTLRFGARATSANSVLDMGLSGLPLILPKNPSRPTVGLETGMMYYNSTSDIVEVHHGAGLSVPLVKELPLESTTSATGFNFGTYSTNQDKVVMELDATSNAITQTIPSASSFYKNTRIIFLISNDGSNAVTFNVPVGTVYNSIVGTTSFTAVDKVECYCNGSKWIILNK